MPDNGHSKCFASASAAAGRTLSQEELDALFSRAQSRMDRLERSGLSAKEAAIEAGRQLGAEARKAAIIEEFQKKINLAAYHSARSRLREGDEFTSLEGLLAGEERGNARNASLSVNARVKAAQAQAHGALATELKEAGLLKTARGMRDDLENRVAQDMAHLNNPRKFRASGDAHALGIAQAYQRALESTRIAQNKAGAWIGKEELYVARQSHDMLKVRGKGPEGDFKAWHDSIRPLLDDRTFDNKPDTMTEEAYLHSLWSSLASGVHQSANGADWLKGFKGPGNAAKRASQERVIHFKGPQEWMTYNRQFGTGSLHEAVLKSVSLGSRNAALMRELGTNPEAMFDRLLGEATDNAVRRDDLTTSDKLAHLKDHALIDALTGKAAPVRNWTASRVGANLRALESLTKLGGVVLSSIPDIAVRASSLRSNGVPLLESYWRTFSDLLPSSGSKYRRRMAHSMGIGVQGMLGEMAGRFAMADGPSGVMHRSVNWLHKVNGLSYWTDSLKAGAAGMLLNHLGEAAAGPFEKLHPRMRNALARYGIEAREWETIRQAARQGEDGNTYLMPGDIRQLHEDQFASVSSGKLPGEARDEIADRLAAYVNDVADDALSEPDFRTVARTSAINHALDNVSPWLGQAMRMVAQFKSYPISFLRRAWAREVKRDGPDGPGLVHLMVGTTLLGYAAMSAKAIVAGKNPRDPSDPSTWGAAMQQGGGLGIYGDFLFGESNRMGNTLLETLAGPALGDIANLYRAYQASRDEISGDEAAPTQGSYLSNLTRVARGLVPGGNLFYTKMAIDHLFYYELQNAINPGYTRRMQTNALRQHGETYWLNPSWTPY